ncbi:hypothetical protein EHE19_018115 [Ruminiclostridium herbifermentans]|uniref:Uncharacterized protein n=1 Tax=Ruminiclostridium herbifermentans TaxID=2488810 RepID=A0A4U7J992_9FIRM|nr:hypothetical protein [Ruminiclostridium herbifermentans]QNU66729.1 hypothetical protein EHE19_018115 [Ruminiclostridium herbifermentans]
MKKRLQGFIAGMLVCSLFLSIPVFAAGVNRTIKAVFNEVTVKIDGKAVSGDKITYNKNVYVNIKNVSQILGKDYKVDKNGNISLVDKTKPIPTPAPTQPSLSSRKNPAGIDDAINMTTTFTNGNTFDSIITLKGIIRGNDAWNKILAANQFNDKPEDSYEYILAKFSFKVDRASNDNIQFDLNRYGFKLVSGEGKDYDFYSCVLPEPVLDAKLYSGSSNEGWVAFKVKTTDLKPLIVYGKGNDGTGGIWFKGYDNDIRKEAIQTPTPSTSNVLSSVSDLKNFLETNYSELKTNIGTTKFTFDIYENDASYTEWDYWIMVKYDYNYFEGAMTSIKYTDEQKNLLRQELQNFQEKMAKAVISEMPNKKFYGGYYDSWYKYPNLKVDLQTRRYYSWKNYDDASITTDINQKYNSTKASTFRWWSMIDDKL